MPRPRAPPGSAGSGPGGQQLKAGGGQLAGGDQQQRELLQRPRPAVIATQPRPSRICPAWTGLLTRGHGGLTVTSGRWAGPVLLIVMYESQTWRVRPGEPFTFGRAPACSAVLPAGDRGVSRHAGSFGYRGGCWWLHNDSSSAMLGVLGDRGFRADVPPGLQVPLQQWHAKVSVSGVLGI